MSEALNYLVKVRPDAMTHYFKFLKDAGSKLDVKTRDLISVITKVDVQTEGGLRQYLTRAMRNGATPEEIIDALLMAFPTLGLAKIVWAVDIILDMDIPEFRPELINAQEGWHDVCAAQDVGLGETKRFDAGGRAVFVYRDSNGYRVYDSRCPHQVTDIPNLALEGKKLTCPKHKWVFDIESGECVERGSRPLRLFESKVENDRLHAFW